MANIGDGFFYCALSSSIGIFYPWNDEHFQIYDFYDLFIYVSCNIHPSIILVAEQHIDSVFIWNCSFYFSDGPLWMVGDTNFGRILIDENTYKRCFYCCSESYNESCQQTYLSGCGLRQVQPLPQPIQQPRPQPQRHHLNSPCTVIKTWPNGPRGLPKFQVVCSWSDNRVWIFNI